jgi:thiamine-phosphate pyrophosphorylase
LENWNMLDLSLYVLIDPAQLDGQDCAEVARLAADGGATLVQYRDKHGTTRQMIANAIAIKQALAPFATPLLINDRVDVAMAAGADGVHLGQDDMPTAMARALLGDDALIGITLKTAQDIEQAELGVIDYGCIGGVFATTSKQNNMPPLGLQGLGSLVDLWRARDGDMPLAAIAGINLHNAASVIQSGVDGVAVMSAVTAAADVKNAASLLKQSISQARQRRQA